MSLSRCSPAETLPNPLAHLYRLLILVCICLIAPEHVLAAGQNASGPPGALEEQLLKEEPVALGQEARERGDPARGAVVFFQPGLTCAKCHNSKGKEPMI